MELLKRLLWFIKSDVELNTVTCWYGKEEKIDGFYFYTKKPFSKSYQWHGKLGLENTYKVLYLIENAIRKNRKAVLLEIHLGLGSERVYIWKGSLKKARNQLFKMIKEIQCQY